MPALIFFLGEIAVKLLIENLGPIKNNKQTIDLSKKFYVFVGANNSGKTYVSQLLWTIFNGDIIKEFARDGEFEEIDLQSDRIEISEKLLSNILEKFSSFLESKLLEIYHIENNNSDLGKLPVSLSFEVEIEEFKSKKLEWGFLTPNENISEELEKILVFKSQNSLIVNLKRENIPEDYFEDFPKEIREKLKEHSMVSLFVILILNKLLNGEKSPFFLPANRSFYATFYQYIYEIERDKREEELRVWAKIIENEIVESNFQGRIRIDDVRQLKKDIRKNLFQRAYTEPMSQVFEAIYSLNQETQLIKHYENLVTGITEIMQGDIMTERFEGISPIQFTFRVNKENDVNLPMYLASSSVNQLTLLYLYWKYWAEEDDNFLFIDEPEENLHPSNQIKLVDLLIQFATSENKNNRVLITTHSPLLTDTINTYLYLGTLKEEYNLDVEEIIEDKNLQDFNPETSISEEELGVYFFSGSKIIDYEAEEYGVYFRDFREVTEKVDRANKILTDYIYLQRQKECEDE